VSDTSLPPATEAPPPTTFVITVGPIQVGLMLAIACVVILLWRHRRGGRPRG
jgi:hypothetical protein